MKKLLFALCLLVGISSGCNSIAEDLLSDVGGLDLSACVDGFDTCLELVLDNTDKIDLSSITFP